MTNPIGYVDGTVNVMTGCIADFDCYRDCWARKWAHRHCHNPTFSRKDRAKYAGFRPAYWPERLKQLPRGKGKWKAVNFMGDMFCRGQRQEAQDATLAVLGLEESNTYLILTKRSGAMLSYMQGWKRRNIPWDCSNVLFGTSVSTPADVRSRLPALMKLAKLGFRVWVSVEPMMEAVDLRKYMKRLAWVVCGDKDGEIPPAEWFNDLFWQCRYAPGKRVPFWLKGKGVAKTWQRKPEFKP